MAAIEVLREETGHLTYGRYCVLIDGEEVGTLRNREKGHYEVAPGRHDVAVTLSRSGSQTLSLSLGDQEMVRLGCRLIGFRSRLRVARYETDRSITLEALEEPAGADIHISAGPTVTAWNDRHRIIAVAIAVLGLLMLTDSFLLLHLGEVRAWILGASMGAAALPFAYLEWLPRSRRVEALKTTGLGICVTVFAVFTLAAHLPLGFTVVEVIVLAMGICCLTMGIIRLFDLGDS
jgi:hypothetical protein